MKNISIIIPVDNTYALTNNFFEHLKSVINFIDFEIIIMVDGCKNIDVRNYLNKIDSEYENCKLFIYDDKQSYSIINNLAVKESTCEYLVFINTDVFPNKHAIENLVDYIIKNENIGAVQGLLIYPQSNLVQSTGHIFGNFINNHALEGRKITDPIIQKIQERQALTAAFYAIEKKLFVELGGFDEFYHNAWEGMELTLKIFNKGYKCIYLPSAVAYHARGGARNFTSSNEEQQSAYFWSKWGNIVKSDIESLYIKQLTSEMIENRYMAINCSYIKNINAILEKINIKSSECITIANRFGENINLYFELPYSIQKYQGNLLFFTNHFSKIKNNNQWIKNREEKQDIVLDLSGNVLFLKDLL